MKNEKMEWVEIIGLIIILISMIANDLLLFLIGLLVKFIGWLFKDPITITITTTTETHKKKK
ncbi:MAG: hypothetical protein MR425_02940 [Lachnospiraceae bacterium]|nr:hypothetical protein [Lachnospiraceae bacterium]